jgi:glycogen operon protein
LRMQQTRNLLALNLLSVGTPMMLMGDEVCRTQLEPVINFIPLFAFV